VSEAAPSLALRCAGKEFALEAGRDYVLGAADDCDVRVRGAGPQHLRLRIGASGAEFEDLGSGLGTWLGKSPCKAGIAGQGEHLYLGRAEVTIVADRGHATIVPLPELRVAARRRKLDAALTNARANPRGETFAGMLADEMAHAPWFGLSMAAHAVVLFALWLLLTPPPDGSRRPATVEVVLADASPTEPPPEVPAVEPETKDEMTLTDEPVTAPDEVVAEPIESKPLETIAALGKNPALPFSRGRKGGDVGNTGSLAFRQAVGQLRQSGLEIVFVFDSTGSMTRTINDTKSTIHEMLLVLRALIPDARIGMVTYRDRGKREDYVTRDVPLGNDYWQAINFVNDVLAEGGGDRPEAVREGIECALAQPWRSGSRRVIVLAGDAPPHDDGFAGLLQKVKTFSKDGRSFVHTLLTTPQFAGDDTRDAFAKLAEAGKGQAVELHQRDGILLEVLSLAFGREFRGDLEQVKSEVLAAREYVDTKALDLARRGGEPLRTALCRVPVEPALVNALIRRPRKAVFRELHAMLEDTATPNATRQAVAWTLQKALDLPMSPVDAKDPRLLNHRVYDRTQRAIERLPD
jgi:hypothetical protein